MNAAATPIEGFIFKVWTDLRTVAEERIKRFDFVEHYTSAAGALGILRNEEVWFTNVANMNDISEVLGGCRIANQALLQEGPATFAAFPSLVDEVRAHFEVLFEKAHGDTYAFCLSGHDPGQASGRLAMWRSYGSDGAGVCLVLKREPIMQIRTLDFPINWVPMICESPDQLRARVIGFLQGCRDALTADASLLQNARNVIVDVIAYAMLVLGIAHKHEQFSYEQEIRFIHLKNLQAPIADRMAYDGEVVRGILQPIFKVKLADYSDRGAPDCRVSNILAKILVGPSPSAHLQAKGLTHVLTKQGLSQVPVEICQIPYRSLNHS